MDPWAALVEFMAPYSLQCKYKRPPFALGTTLHVKGIRQRNPLSGPAIEEAFFDVPLSW